MEIKYRIQKKRNRNNWKDIALDYNKGLPIKDIMKKYDISRTGMYFILEKAKKEIN